MAAVGAALGPLGGSAHGSSAPDGPSLTASAPGTSSPASAAPAAPPPAPSGSASPSALPSALPVPSPPSSGVPASGAAGSGPVPSSPAATGKGAQAPAGPEAEDDAPESSSPSASPEVSGSTAPLAGREAGAGKARPGRSLSPLELARAEDPVEEVPAEETDEGQADPVDLPVSTPPPDAFSDPGQRSGQALDATAVQRVQQVSLGTGIALVGLGLGFLAFRMRRTN